MTLPIPKFLAGILLLKKRTGVVVVAAAVVVVAAAGVVLNPSLIEHFLFETGSLYVALELSK